MELHWFIEEKTVIDNDLLCMICQNVLLDPRQLSGCKHSYCKSCLDQWSKLQKRCPACRTTMQENAPNEKATEHITKLQVKCRNHDMGCVATGVLGSAPTFWDTHEAADCQIKKCQYCGFRTTELQVHLETCDQVTVPCPFHKIGCTVTPKKAEVQDHVDACIEWHYSLLVQAVVEREPQLINLPANNDVVWEEHGCRHCTKKPIVGAAYKCKSCGDVMCLECQSLSKHPKDHSLVKLKPPSSVRVVVAPAAPNAAEEKKSEEVPLAVHRGVRCDGCNTSAFKGIRHKCLICNDFDLCEACVGRTVENHYPWHPMIVLDTADSTIWNRIKASLGVVPKNALLNLEAHLPLDESFTRAQWIAQVEACKSVEELLPAIDELRNHLVAGSWKRVLDHRINACFNLCHERKMMANPAMARLVAFEWMIDWSTVPAEKRLSQEQRMQWRKSLNG
eukprot:TRINITY_DN11032_c0_g1_i1.p1 TRINITY_DN11032_c0_g1~~TRINITY_DN11032_c0_g1_i1.p1  ORF type:complete len:449 (+),score=76.19 TRINITY_DN11032_c0_g1_i1:8-1354(+)